MMFYEAPARLDWAEVWRIWRQKEQSSSDLFDEFANRGSVMNPEVVEHDDIARVQSGTEGVSNEFDAARSIHGAYEVTSRAGPS